jgi:hypothetical protein
VFAVVISGLPVPVVVSGAAVAGGEATALDVTTGDSLRVGDVLDGCPPLEQATATRTATMARASVRFITPPVGGPMVAPSLPRNNPR